MSYAGPIISGVGTGVGAGASIYGIIQGKKAQDQATKALRDILGQQTSDARGIMAQTGPLRSLTAGNLASVLAGGRTDNLRVFAPERESLEGQFTQAKNNIIAQGERGGMLDRSLADVNIARAQAVSGLESNVRQKAFEDALRIGYGVAPSVSFPAFQGASNTLSGLAGMGQQQQAAGGAGLGSVAALGALMTMKGQNRGTQG